MADEDFFSLYEIGRIAVVIDASTIESCACHVLAAPADEAVVEGEIVVFTVELFYVALHYWDAPTEWQSIVSK